MKELEQENTRVVRISKVYSDHPTILRKRVVSTYFDKKVEEGSILNHKDSKYPDIVVLKHLGSAEHYENLYHIRTVDDLGEDYFYENFHMLDVGNEYTIFKSASESKEYLKDIEYNEGVLKNIDECYDFFDMSQKMVGVHERIDNGYPSKEDVDFFKKWLEVSSSMNEKVKNK